MKLMKAEKFWLLAPTILLEKFKNIFWPILSLFFLFSYSTFAQKTFDLSLGDDVRVLSEKAFRSAKENRFEAVGNVIVNHGTNAIYGEKASISFLTKKADVIGNVRYVGPEMTLYGSKLHYDFTNSYMKVQNARLISDNFIVLGKEIVRGADGNVSGTEMEYTTCRDCPESWSVFGKRIHITLGEYIRIYHAYIKINGVVVLYMPYIILPIKQDRESGLLFPNFGVESDEGVRFQQPFFLAINKSSDATIAPAVWGRRGFGGELQYRQSLGEKTWFELNSLSAWDRIYAPGKLTTDLTGDQKFRHLSDYEHHYAKGFNWNHHLYVGDVKDLDVVRDFEFRSNDKVLGPEISREGFVDYRNSLFNVSLEGYFNQNQLTPNAEEFDNDFVQILPKVSLKTVPFHLIQSDLFGFNKITAGLESDFTIFRQNIFNEAQFIRNAHRINARPYIDWKLGYLGPVFFKTKAIFDSQYYHFPNEDQGRYFSKSGIIYESEARFEIERIFGVSYQTEVETKKTKIDKLDNKQEKKTDLIGSLPPLKQSYNNEKILIKKDSYRHAQDYRIRHFFLSDQKTSGSSRFLNQIREEAGQFDPIDAIRENENDLSDVASRTSLSLNNTVEFQFNNSLIRKSSRKFNAYEDGRYLRDNFDYSRVAFFNISQGYDFNIESDDIRDKLTRLYFTGGFTVDDFSVTFSEFYFYNSDENIFNLTFAKNFERGNINLGLNLNSFSIPVNKFLTLEGQYDINDLFQVRGELNYDIEEERNVSNVYGFLYSPVNNCWKLDLRYETTLVDERYSFNILINFNENSFTSFSQE